MTFWDTYSILYNLQENWRKNHIDKLWSTLTYENVYMVCAFHFWLTRKFNDVTLCNDQC